MVEKTRTLYDLVKDRLRKAERVTYVHRIIYLGEHNFSFPHKLREFYEQIIKSVNNQNPNEILTGFLLCYKKQFIHLLEGSEDTILRHLRRMYEQKNEEDKQFGNIKVVLACYHIHQRFFKNWIATMANPPSLVEDIKPNIDAEATMHIIRSCINKIYKLSEYLGQQPATSLNNVLDRLSSTVPQFLPETQVISFFLQSEALLGLTAFKDMFFNISTKLSYHECIWPTPESLTPLNFLDPDEYVFLCDMDVLKKPECSEEEEPSNSQ